MAGWGRSAQRGGAVSDVTQQKARRGPAARGGRWYAGRSLGTAPGAPVPACAGTQPHLSPHACARPGTFSPLL